MYIVLLRDCQQIVPGELFPRDRRKGDVVDVTPETARRAVSKGMAAVYEPETFRRIPDD